MEAESLIHITVIVVGIIPGLVAMSFIKRNGKERWRHSNFFLACLLLGLSILMVGMLFDLQAEVEKIREDGAISHGVFSQLKNSGAIWLVMFPLIFGGVGVNVLAAYLQSRNPNQP